MYDFTNKELPYKKDNLEYLYCVSKYPASYEDIKMPDFNNSFFSGYSDHTIGIGSCLFAASRGAKIIEKHYSNNKSLNTKTEMAHVCSMDQNDLLTLRNLSDSLNLLQSFKG